MKFETYAIYMRAIVYYMNYLQSRKGIEEATGLLDSLDIQNQADNQPINSNGAGEMRDINYHPHEASLPEMIGDFENINYQPQEALASNCPTCNSQDIEFDINISRVVCMGCGKELPYDPFDIRNPEIEVM